MERVTIGSREAKLQFACSERSDDGAVRLMTARLVAPGLSAERLVYEPEECGGYASLASFFEEMAVSWRGWEGEREFYSLEGDLAMTAVHDGHVRIAARLTEHSGPDQWTVQAKVVIDAGEDLTNAATAIRALVQDRTASN